MASNGPNGTASLRFHEIFFSVVTSVTTARVSIRWRRKLRLLTFDELKAQKGIPYCRDHTRRLGDLGKFPKAIKLGDGERAKIAFVEEEIDAWLAERAALRAPAAE